MCRITFVDWAKKKNTKKTRIDKKQIRCPVGKFKTVCFIFEGEIDQTVKENVLTSKGLWLN